MRHCYTIHPRLKAADSLSAGGGIQAEPPTPHITPVSSWITKFRRCFGTVNESSQDFPLLMLGSLCTISMLGKEFACFNFRGRPHPAAPLSVPTDTPQPPFTHFKTVSTTGTPPHTAPTADENDL